MTREAQQADGSPHGGGTDAGLDPTREAIALLVAAAADLERSGRRRLARSHLGRAERLARDHE